MFTPIAPPPRFEVILAVSKMAPLEISKHCSNKIKNGTNPVCNEFRKWITNEIFQVLPSLAVILAQQHSGGAQMNIPKVKR